MIRHSYNVDVSTGRFSRQIYTFKVDTYGELQDRIEIKLMRWRSETRVQGMGWSVHEFWTAAGESWPFGAKRAQRASRPPVEARMKDMVWAIIKRDIRWR